MQAFSGQHRGCLLRLCCCSLLACLPCDGRIPSQLVLTAKSDSLAELPAALQEHVHSVRSANPGLRLRWLGDLACRNYLEAYFGKEWLAVFLGTLEGRFRSDICRAAVLLREGGFYMDLDLEPAVPFREMVDESTSFMSAYCDAGILNALIATEAGNAVMNETMAEIWRWHHGAAGTGDYTGPATMQRGLQHVVRRECPDVDLLQKKAELQWTCGTMVLRLYHEGKLDCGVQSPSLECPPERARSALGAVRAGLFKPGPRRELVAWPRLAGCAEWGCGAGGYTSPGVKRLSYAAPVTGICASFSVAAILVVWVKFNLRLKSILPPVFAVVVLAVLLSSLWDEPRQMSATQAWALPQMDGLQTTVLDRFMGRDHDCDPDQGPCPAPSHQPRFMDINGHDSDVRYIGRLRPSPIDPGAIPVLLIGVHRSWADLPRLARSIDFPITEIVVHQDGGFRHDAEAVLELRRILPVSLVRRVSHFINLPRAGCAQGWNAGIRRFPSAHYWLISGADVRFPPGSLERIHEAMTAESMKGNDSSASVMYPLMACQTAYCFFGITRSAVQRVGLFDENFFPVYFEDNDFNNRAGMHGLQATRMENIFIVHGRDTGIYESGTLRNYQEQRGWLKTALLGDGKQEFYKLENRSAGMHYYWVKWKSGQEGLAKKWLSKQDYFEWKIWRPVEPNFTTPFGIAGADASLWVFNAQRRACAIGLQPLGDAPDCSGYETMPL